MKIACNRVNLKRYAKDLLGNEWSVETERQLIKACLTGFERTYGHVSHDQVKHLEKIDKILHTYGVEGFIERGLDCSYCNTGDTYNMTVMYINGRLCIGDWGSCVEALG